MILLPRPLSSRSQYTLHWPNLEEKSILHDSELPRHLKGVDIEELQFLVDVSGYDGRGWLFLVYDSTLDVFTLLLQVIISGEQNWSIDGVLRHAQWSEDMTVLQELC
jgi:hypothetical protein